MTVLGLPPSSLFPKSTVRVGEEEEAGSYDKLGIMQCLMLTVKAKITLFLGVFFPSHLQNVVTNLSLGDKNEMPLQTSFGVSYSNYTIKF